MAAGGTATGARRLQASLFLICCSAAGSAPHALPAAKSLWPALALTLLLGLYAFRAVFWPLLRRASMPDGLNPLSVWPAVDLVVAARDEQAVVGRLVERLAELTYPKEQLRLWVIDDGSDDGTPQVLESCQRRYPQLQVLRRSCSLG